MATGDQDVPRSLDEPASLWADTAGTILTCSPGWQARYGEPDGLVFDHLGLELIEVWPDADGEFIVSGDDQDGRPLRLLFSRCAGLVYVRVLPDPPEVSRRSGRLLRQLAHDFGNQAHIVGSLARELAVEGEVERQLLSDLERTGRELSLLTERMRAFARAVTLERQPVELAGLLDEVLARAEGRLDGWSINLDGLSPRLVVDGDPVVLARALLDFLTLASQAAPGEVIELSATADHGRFELQLRSGATDLGDWLGEALHLDAVEQTIVDVGFAILVSAVTEHGGGLRAISGRDRVAMVTLPCRELADLRPAAAPAGKAPRPGAARILVAEDEALVAGFVRRAIESAGFECQVVGNGQQAWEVLSSGEKSFDLLVLDVNMPVLTGDKLAARLVEAGLQLPTIVTTGHAESEALLRLCECGYEALLLKPYRMGDLLAAIRRALGESS